MGVQAIQGGSGRLWRVASLFPFWVSVSFLGFWGVCPSLHNLTSFLSLYPSAPGKEAGKEEGFLLHSNLRTL